MTFLLPDIKFQFFKIRSAIFFLAATLAAIIFFSCENKINLLPKSELLALPAITVRYSETFVTDSGKLQLIMYAPLIEKYEIKDNAYTEFRSGINVIFYDGKEAPVASASSKYAKYTEANNLWELKDSVVVLNESNDKLETELLFWDQKKDLIYTDRFVKITNPDQVTQAFGFESDSHLRNQRLKKVSAIIYLKEDE
jgi:LPS export ABC transporter protein LptC